MTNGKKVNEAKINEAKINEEKIKKEKSENISSGYYENAPKFGHKGPSKLKMEARRKMGSFLVVAASIVFYFLFLRFANLFSGFGIVFDILKPIIYGLAFAYLLHPIVVTIEERLTPILGKKMKKEGADRRLARIIGIAIALIVTIAFIVTMCNLIIPELYNSIKNMIYTVPSQLNTWMIKLNSMETDNSTLGIIAENIIKQGTEYFQTWLKTDLLKQINIIMSNLTVGVVRIIGEILNIVIGLIVSIYVLNSKELFASQCKKIIYAIMTPGHANMTLHIARKSNKIFGGFIIGKIIDSLIIGILCFIGLSILKMPYTLLVSVIVGVTNVIPFFGPYIGAIPCAVLILLEDPTKGIYFIIFIFLLQQLDGNVIGPKILGDATGLSAFWVIFSILLGGGLFGFVGMIMGVPTFAVIYYIVAMIIDQRLEKKKLPTTSNEYDEMSYVDEVSGKFVKRGTTENAN